MQLIRSVYPTGQTGSIQSDIQDTFGLESLVTKLILTVVEVSGKKGLNQQIFQSMVTSEIVEINKKNKMTTSIPNWLIPMIWCMNDPPNWVDQGNCLGRRIVPFSFYNPPLHADSDLWKHVQDELGLFIIKANKAYLHVRNLVKPGMSLHDVLPLSLREAIQELTSRFNPLAAFFSDESELVYEPDQETSSIDLSARIKNYMQNNRGIRNYDTSNIDKNILSYTRNQVTRVYRTTVRNGRNVKIVSYKGMRLI